VDSVALLLGQGLGHLRIHVDHDARRITDDARLHALADAYESKFGEDWHFDVRDGTFHQGDIEALVYEVAPTTAFGFGRGERCSQTRCRFEGA